MSIIKVQINHTQNLNEKMLAAHLYDEIGEEYGLDEYYFEDYIDVEKVYQIPNGNYISIFTLEFPELELRDLEPKDVVKSYLDTLNNLEEVNSLVKLQDGFLQALANEYFSKLFDIEMELRNVLTYILTFDEKPIDKGIFKEFGVQLAESYNNNNAEQNYENGLYYILFNHYASFGEPKKLRVEQVSDILQDISLSDFQDFKNRLQRRYISETRHTEFLFSITQKLKPLEDIRNSVMHIRNLSETKMANFDKAVNDSGTDKGIQTLIQEFWAAEQNELNEKTWLQLAEKQIRNLVEIRKNGDDLLYKMIDDYYHTEFDDYYNDVEEFRDDLIDYLDDKVCVPEFDTEQEEFELKVNELIDRLLIPEQANA